MSGYRRFVAYVYEYRKGKKESNCGFIKVEVRREFDSLGSPNASQSLIRLYFFCQFLILYFHVMPSYVIITMR